jgi:hypothetical protein
VELDFEKANKKGSKEIDPIGKVCGETVEDGCCEGL